MEQYHFPLFLFNIVLILTATSLGYFLAPRLLAGVGDDDRPQAVRATRSILAAAVALYMFFNCLGYFRGEGVYLLAVTALAAIDIALQCWVRRRRPAPPADDSDGLE